MLDRKIFQEVDDEKSESGEARELDFHRSLALVDSALVGNR